MRAEGRTRVMAKKILFAFALLLFVGSVSQAEAAKCTSDYWGARGSFIGIAGETTAQIHGSTNVTHFSNHSGCSGTFSVRVALTGGAFCETTTQSKTHYADGTNTSTSVVK